MLIDSALRYNMFNLLGNIRRNWLGVIWSDRTDGAHRWFSSMVKVKATTI